MGFIDELKRIARPYGDEEEEEEEVNNVTHLRTDDDDDDETDAHFESVKSSRNGFTSATNPNLNAVNYDSKVVNINTTTQVKVIIARPKEFNDASEIADYLRNKHMVVVLNLEETDNGEARRLIDFLSGVAYALDGTIKKIALSTYILTPHNVDLLSDQAVLDGLEQSGMFSSWNFDV